MLPKKNEHHTITHSTLRQLGFYRHPLTIAVGLTLFSSASFADTNSCGNPYALDWVPACDLTAEQLRSLPPGCDGMYVEPTNPSPEANLQPGTAPIRASADNSQITQQNRVVFSGNVEINQGSQRIFADEAIAEKDKQLLELQGKVVIRQNGLLMQGKTGAFNTANGTGSLSDAEFVMHQEKFRGSADLISKTSDDTLNLYNTNFTRCAPGNNAWFLHGDEIDLDRAYGFGTAKHAKVYVKDVPIAYFPYFSFPIDDRRRTGFLVPTLSTSSTNSGSGLDLTVPYYLNLAEDYDATVTPHYITGRGTGLELETRYKNQYSEWRFSGAQIDDSDYGEKRWLYGVNEEGNIGKLSHSIDYTHVSDEDYFSDITTESLDVQRQTQLDQKAEATYRGDLLSYKIGVYEYQTINDTVTEPYQRRPQIEIEKDQLATPNQLNVLFFSQYTDFFDTNGNKTEGQRVYLEPGLSLPLENRWGFVTTTAKIRNINYNLKLNEDDNATNGDNTGTNGLDDDKPSVVSGMASIDAGLNFEKNIDWFGGSFTQTLEPRVYYLYSQYKNQDNNPLFDTGELTFSYNQLFRDTRFSGYDRIDDANQLSTGVTTRFIDNNTGIERGSFSIGQIHYFEDRKIGIADYDETDYQTTTSQSDIVSEASYRLNKRFRANSNVLWSTETNDIKEGDLTLRYNDEGRLIINASYRKTNSPDQNIYDDNDQVVDVLLGNVKQSDISGVVPLPFTDQWSFIGRYNYDHTNNRVLEQIVGIEYNSCCWRTQLVFQKGVDGNNEQQEAVYLQFILKGLGGIANGLNLDDSIVGFKEREENDI